MADFSVHFPPVDFLPISDLGGKLSDFSPEFLNSLSQTEAAWNSAKWAQLSTYATWLAAIITLAALIVAFFTYINWRRQLTSEREFSQLIDALQALAKFERLIEDQNKYFSIGVAVSPSTASEYRNSLAEAFSSLERATIGLEEIWKDDFKIKRERLRRLGTEINQAIANKYEFRLLNLTERHRLLLNENKWGDPSWSDKRQKTQQEIYDTRKAVENFIILKIKKYKDKTTWETVKAIFTLDR